MSLHSSKRFIKNGANHYCMELTTTTRPVDNLLEVLHNRRAKLEERAQAASHLAKFRDERAVQENLIAYANSPDLSKIVIRGLIELNDSRSLFPLLNLYQNTDRFELKKDIMQYVHETADPRAIDFLEEFMAKSGLGFKALAKKAYDRCSKNVEFPLQFAGPKDLYTKSIGFTNRIPVTSKNLDAKEATLKSEFKRLRPQTYIVDTNWDLYVGGDVHEHVLVAQGRDVLAAGEVILSNESGEGSPKKWKVEYINQRSNGYHPATICFPNVARAFAQTDVALNQAAFTEMFPKNGYNDSDFLSTFSINNRRA